MSTKPHHTPADLATDAENVLALVREPDVQKVLDPHLAATELSVYETRIHELRLGAGARTASLHAQVAAGAHTGAIRARIYASLLDLRADAVEKLPKNPDAQKAFLVGVVIHPGDNSSIEAAALQAIAAASSFPDEAKVLGFDDEAIHLLETKLHALTGAHVAHVKAAGDRHDETTATDSLAHVVAAETAHLRRLAKRWFRQDQKTLAKFASKLPRYTVKHRSPHAPEPSASAAGTPTKS